MRTLIAPLALGLILSACGGSGQSAKDAPITPGHNLEEPELPAATPTVATTPYAIEACKAAIGTLMGRDPKTMKGRKIEGGLIHVSYIRPDDGKRWQARCRIDDASHLTWTTFDAFGDGLQGRWRDEDTIEFTVSGSKMHVKVSTGGELVSEETYAMARLK